MAAEMERYGDDVRGNTKDLKVTFQGKIFIGTWTIKIPASLKNMNRSPRTQTLCVKQFIKEVVKNRETRYN
jgi:hypothetical protein